MLKHILSDINYLLSNSCSFGSGEGSSTTSQLEKDNEYEITWKSKRYKIH